MNQTCALFSVVSRLRHYDAAAPRSRRRLETRHTRRDDLIGGFATHFAQLLERFGKSLFGRFTVTLNSLGEGFGFNLEIDRQSANLGHNLRFAKKKEHRASHRARLRP